MIVRTVFDGCAVAPVEGISPVDDTEVGGGDAVAPVEGISPARAIPESTHARTTANVKRLILSASPLKFEDASLLA